MIDKKSLRRVSELNNWKSRRIAEVLGISQRTVQRLWKDYGMKPLRPSRSLTAERLRILYHVRNLTLDEIAAISPWGRSTIVRYLRKAGLLNKRWNL